MAVEIWLSLSSPDSQLFKNRKWRRRDPRLTMTQQSEKQQ